MLIICPTADYELFLGRNALPAEDVLFEPTRKLLAVWAEFDIRGTLFPDICSIWRHRELGISAYADACEAQLKNAAASGHDIQLHLHPEWRSAELRNGTWSFRSGTHSLHDLGFSPDDPQGASELIRKGKLYLEGLLRGSVPRYRCIAFRAGGWIVQPEQALFAALLSEGIRVDASVIPGMKSGRTDYGIDFRAVPDKPMWRIDPREGIGVDSGRREDVLEISIASYRGRFPLWQHVVNQLRLRTRARSFPHEIRGYPITKIGPKGSPLQRVKSRFQKLMIPRVLDMADTHESMLSTVGSYLRRYDCRSGDFAVCFNGHPKDTYDYHLVELRRFLDIARCRYGDVVSFRSIADYVGMEVNAK